MQSDCFCSLNLLPFVTFSLPLLSYLLKMNSLNYGGNYDGWCNLVPRVSPLSVPWREERSRCKSAGEKRGSHARGRSAENKHDGNCESETKKQTNWNKQANERRQNQRNMSDSFFFFFFISLV